MLSKNVFFVHHTHTHTHLVKGGGDEIFASLRGAQDTSAKVCGKHFAGRTNEIYEEPELVRPVSQLRFEPITCKI
jgi:hypothetical protein